MKRGKKIIFVSHCLLNVNVKVLGLATHQSAAKDLIHFLLDHETAMIQLPCPETEILGLCRGSGRAYRYPMFRKMGLDIGNGDLFSVKNPGCQGRIRSGFREHL